MQYMSRYACVFILRTHAYQLMTPYAYLYKFACVPFKGAPSGGRRKSVGKARWLAVARLAAQADFALPGRSPGEVVRSRRRAFAAARLRLLHF